MSKNVGQKRPNVIHSGHFMISNAHDDPNGGIVSSKCTRRNITALYHVEILRNSHKIVRPISAALVF